MTSKKDLEQITSENIIARQFRRAVYAFNPERVVLDSEQYCNIINCRTGDVETLQGACKRSLAYDETVIGQVEQKIVVAEHRYAIIKNPRNPETGEIQHGEIDVRIGPQSFPLYHGEEFDGDTEPERVLTKYDGVLVHARTDFDGHKAGEEFLVTGPRTYIPSKRERMVGEVKGIPLSNTDGIYVQDKNTGEVRLVTGAEEEVIYFLQPNEQKFEKELTQDELAGLGLVQQTSRGGVRILTRQAANASYLEDKSKAIVLELEENEIVQIYDGSETRIEQGPKTTFLGPYERPKVLTLSGGKPIGPNALKVALLKLGPDFIYDRISVRTKDNAQLQVDVTYKWRFRLDDGLKKAFSIDDFVGYTAETLSSEIRSVSAQHDFEQFHANALSYIKDAVFGNGNRSRVFEENGLEIFGIDVTAINPSDKGIAEKLHDALRNNMEIYCKKIVLTATLESERQEVEGKRRIETERETLIQLEAKNRRLQVLEEANTQAEARRIDAESSAAARRIKAEAEADARRIEADAATESERKRLAASIEELNKGGAERYIDLQKANTFNGSEKLVVVPTESKIVLPFARYAGGGQDE